MIVELEAYFAIFLMITASLKFSLAIVPRDENVIVQLRGWY